MKSPRIALLGNCQAVTLYRCFKLLAPSVEVARFPFSDLPGRFPTREAVFAEFARFDMIFAQPFGPGLHPTVDGLILKERFQDRFYFYPVVEFSAFHPDCVYIRHRKSRDFFPSPIGDYHSAIALFGFALGLTAGQTTRLFDAEVFERLGYFRFWKVSEDALMEQCRAIEFPVAGLYRSWVRRGSFMHSINHPKLFVLAGVARTLLEMSGCPSVAGNAEDYLADDALFDPVWPVYPEIAEAMDLEGAYIFKGGSSQSGEGTPFLTLRDFVERSYELYRKAPPGALECQRVDEWAGNAALVEYLRKHAGA